MPFTPGTRLIDWSSAWARLRSSTLVRAAGVYAAASWAALQVVDTVSGFVPMPEWLPTLALTLIGVGFPVVMATALVQRRVDRLREVDAEGRLPAADGADADDDRDPAEELPIPGSAAGRVVDRLFTWRNTILGGVAATVLWGGVTAVWLISANASRGGGPRDLTSIESVAVLPFADLSPGGDQEYFSDGLTEELLNALAQIPGLRVPARTSSFAFEDRNEDIREIGRALNVEAVLEGSVRKQDRRLRITAQLIAVESGYHIWSTTYDGTLEDVFELQEEIAGSVARILVAEAEDSASDRVAAAARDRPPTGDIDAYEVYLRGRSALNERTPASLEEALEYFRRALSLDPGYAEAHAGLAAAHNLRALNQYVQPAEGFGPGLEAARRAVSLDDGLSGAHTALAMALYLYAWDWAAADSAFQRALELDPNNAQARYFHSMYLSAIRENEAAMLEARRAARLDPLSPPVSMGVGIADFHADRLAQAVDALERTTAWAPDYFLPYSWLGLARVQLGDPEAGVRAARRAVSLNPGSTLSRAMLAETLARAGRTAEARTIVSEIEHRARAEPVPATYIARTRTALGDHAAALSWLEQAIERREGQVIQIRGPGYDDIRQEPRFRDILAVLDFPAD